MRYGLGDYTQRGVTGRQFCEQWRLLSVKDFDKVRVYSDWDTLSVYLFIFRTVSVVVVGDVLGIEAVGVPEARLDAAPVFY